MTKIWVIRAKPLEKSRVGEFLSHNIIALGFPDIGDVTGADREEIKSRLKCYNYPSNRALGQYAEIIYQFVNELNKGDYVLMPDGENIYIGKVTGNYKYDASKDNDTFGYPHEREVEWLINKKAIKRSYLPDKVIRSLRRRPIFYPIGYNDINEILNATYKKNIVRGVKTNYRRINSLHDIYEPNRYERELIAMALEHFIDCGYRPIIALPEIILSDEIPPIFVAYPELEDEIYNDNQEKEEIFSERKREPDDFPRRERRRPETISIEELLGVYIADVPGIILYNRGIKWFTIRHGFPENLLRAIVIVHEVGHWITHLLPKNCIPEWNKELFKLTDENVHEGWAQLITWWVVHTLGGKIEDVFDNLNRNQSSPYHIYEKFINIPEMRIVRSLEKLRQLGRSVELNDMLRLI